MERTVLDREKLAGVGVAVGSVGDGIGRRWGKTGREAASTGPEIEHGRGETNVFATILAELLDVQLGLM